MINKIPNQVIKGRLQPLNLQRVTGIALHHMAHPTADIKTVEGWHLGQGYNAIGYNYWVGFDGTIYEGRGLNQGAHTLGHNDTTIGIGFQGDYSKPFEMPLEQFNAGIDIISYVKSKVPSIVKVGGHKDFMATACPGRYFPLDEMIGGKKRSVKMIYNYIDENTAKIADDCNECLQHLVDNGYLKGNEKGELNLTLEMIRIFLVHYRAGLYD